MTSSPFAARQAEHSTPFAAAPPSARPVPYRPPSLCGRRLHLEHRLAAPQSNQQTQKEHLGTCGVGGGRSVVNLSRRRGGRAGVLGARRAREHVCGRRGHGRCENWRNIAFRGVRGRHPLAALWRPRSRQLDVAQSTCPGGKGKVCPKHLHSRLNTVRLHAPLHLHARGTPQPHSHCKPHVSVVPGRRASRRKPTGCGAAIACGNVCS